MFTLIGAILIIIACAAWYIREEDRIFQKSAQRLRGDDDGGI